MIKRIFEYLQKIKQEILSVVAEQDIFTSAINGDNTQFYALRKKQEYYETNSNNNFSFISTFYATCYARFKKINFFNHNKPSLNDLLKQAIEKACENKNEDMAQYLFSLKKEFLFTPKNIDLLKEIFQAAYNHKSKLAASIYNQATTEVQLQLNSCLSDYESDPLINITDITKIEELINTAAKSNDLTMIKNIYNTQNPIFSMAFGGLLNDPNIMEDAFIIAAKNSSMDVVKYLFESLPKCAGQIRPTVLKKAIKDKLDNNNQSNDFNLIKYLARHRFITTIEALQGTANSTTSGSIQTQSQLLIEACRKEYENGINFVLIGFGLKKPKLQSVDICNIIFQFSGHSEICADLNTFGSLLFRSIPNLTNLYKKENNTSGNDQVPLLLHKKQSAAS